MIMSNKQIILTLLMVISGTVIVRFLPFALFPSGKKIPGYIIFLGKVIPYSVMGLLVVYCLKDITVKEYPYGIPEVICIVIVSLLHIWKKNILLSIGIGTIIYMLSVQYVFI